MSVRADKHSSMERPLSPIFDAEGTEVSRDDYWGQKELGAALGTTPKYVGDLLRLIGLLRPESKEATAEALSTGAALYVTVDTADGPHTYPRWRKDLVLDVLRRALQDYPKPPTRSQQITQSRSVAGDSGQSLDARIEALERRVEYLERQLRRESRTRT